LTFGVVLAKQAIEILIASSLLRTADIREVHLTIQQFFHRLVMSELDAVIEGDRMDEPILERDADDLRHDPRLQRLHLLHDIGA
jgi:hypothetical protein